MSRAQALVIDDERRYRELIGLNLRRHGFEVIGAADGLAGLNAIEAHSPALVILDLTLPDLDGYDLCERIREHSRVPLIIVSGRTTVDQRIRGLHVGADDYVIKPFSADELLARVDAVMRRCPVDSRGTLPEVLRCGDIEIDTRQQGVSLDGRTVHLTPREYAVLYQLALQPDRVVLQTDLLRGIWGAGAEDQFGLLHSVVQRLRAKIEDDPSEPHYICSRRGIGYYLSTLGD